MEKEGRGGREKWRRIKERKGKRMKDKARVEDDGKKRERREKYRRYRRMKKIKGEEERESESGG